MTKKSLIITVAVSAAVLIGGVALFGPKKDKTTYDTAKVERGSVVQTVEATGAVVSTADVDLRFELSGRIRSVKAKVGDAVKTGAVLAELDNRDASLNVQKAQAAALSAQAAYDKLANGATPEDIKVSEAAVTSAQSNLDVSRQSLTDALQAFEDVKGSNEATIAKAYSDLSGALETLFLKTSSAMQTLTNDVYDSQGHLRNDFTPTDSNLALQATAAFQQAKSAFAQMTIDIAAERTTSDRTALDQIVAAIIAEADIVRNAAQLTNAMLQSSIPAGSATQASLDAKKARVNAAWTETVSSFNTAATQRQAVVSAKASNVSSLNAAQAKISAAQQNVKVYESSLASAQANLALKKAPATSFDLESARAQLAQARAATSAAQVAFEKTRIVAPFNGTIAQVTGRVGSTVSGADVVMRIHGEDVYEIEADVPETDIAKLSVGMTGTVTLDAYGQDKTFPITLTSIDNAETVIQDIVYYKTRFTLTSPDQPVRAGMTANLKVVAAQKDNVLVVPLRSVHTRDDGSKFVRVLKNTQPQETSVTLGLRGDNNRVEALAGVSEGDEVILATYVNGKAV